MPNTIDELRAHLFDTLDRLKDKESPLEIERAKAICEVSGKIIDTAKVEVAFLNVVGGQGSGFIPVGDSSSKPIPHDSGRTSGPKRVTHQ